MAGVSASCRICGETIYDEQTRHRMCEKCENGIRPIIVEPLGISEIQVEPRLTGDLSFLSKFRNLDLGSEMDTENTVTTAANTTETPVAAPATENVTIDATPKVGKAKAATDAALAWARKYSYEVFLVSTIVSIAAFTFLFPRVALYVAGVVSALSGWVAYFGLRKRSQNQF